MAVPTDALELANDLIECGMPREHAEVLAAKLSEKFGLAASEDDLERRLATERELSDARFEALLERIDARFDRASAEMDARFARVDARFAELEMKIYRAVAAGTALILAAISVWAAFG